MYCPHCGRKISKNSRFCKYCGYQLLKMASLQSDHGYQPYHNYQSMNYYNNHIGNQTLYHYGHKYKIPDRPCSFTQAFISFWKHYFNFNGYCSRPEFWWWFLFEYVIDIALYFLYRIVSPNSPSFLQLVFHPSLISQFISNLPSYLVFAAFSTIWGFAIFLPDLSIRIRRLRDAGLSETEWVALLAIDYFSNIVPILGYVVSIIARIITIIIACKPSVRYTHTQKAQSLNTTPL